VVQTEAVTGYPCLVQPTLLAATLASGGRVSPLVPLGIAALIIAIALLAARRRRK